MNGMISSKTDTPSQLKQESKRA